MRGAPVIEHLETYPDNHVTPAQLEPYWGVPIRTLTEWIQRGYLKAYRPGDHKLLITKAEALRFERVLFANDAPYSRQYSANGTDNIH